MAKVKGVSYITALKRNQYLNLADALFTPPRPVLLLAPVETVIQPSDLLSTLLRKKRLNGIKLKSVFTDKQSKERRADHESNQVTASAARSCLDYLVYGRMSVIASVSGNTDK